MSPGRTQLLLIIIVSPLCRFCGLDNETSGHLLKDCGYLNEPRRDFQYTSENPKKGPDIAVWTGLAEHLGIWTMVAGDAADSGPEDEINGED